VRDGDVLEGRADGVAGLAGDPDLGVAAEVLACFPGQCDQLIDRHRRSPLSFLHALAARGLPGPVPLLRRGRAQCGSHRRDDHGVRGAQAEDGLVHAGAARGKADQLCLFPGLADDPDDVLPVVAIEPGAVAGLRPETVLGDFLYERVEPGRRRSS
jgi:hypothetical protein